MAVDTWAVTFGTARRGLGGAAARAQCLRLPHVVDHHYGLFPFSRVCAYFLAYLLSEACLAWKIPAIGVEPFQHPL